MSRNVKNLYPIVLMDDKGNLVPAQKGCLWGPDRVIRTVMGNESILVSEADYSYFAALSGAHYAVVIAPEYQQWHRIDVSIENGEFLEESRDPAIGIDPPSSEEVDTPVKGVVESTLFQDGHAVPAPSGEMEFIPEGPVSNLGIRGIGPVSILKAFAVKRKGAEFAVWIPQRIGMEDWTGRFSFQPLFNEARAYVEKGGGQKGHSAFFRDRIKTREELGMMGFSLAPT